MSKKLSDGSNSESTPLMNGRMNGHSAHPNPPVYQQELISPLDELNNDKLYKPNLEERAGWFSSVIFWWLNVVVIKGYKKPLEDDDCENLRL